MQLTIRRKTQLAFAAAAVLLASMFVAVVDAAPAHAAGWGTLWSKTVNKSVTYTSWAYLGPKFTMAKGVKYKYCVVIKGNGDVNLQPTAFATTVKTTSTYTTKCTKTYTGTGSASQFQAAALMTKSGKTATIKTVYLQRYYTGAVPV